MLGVLSGGGVSLRDERESAERFILLNQAPAGSRQENRSKENRSRKSGSRQHQCGSSNRLGVCVCVVCTSSSNGTTAPKQTAKNWVSHPPLFLPNSKIWPRRVAEGGVANLRSCVSPEGRRRRQVPRPHPGHRANADQR